MINFTNFYQLISRTENTVTRSEKTLLKTRSSSRNILALKILLLAGWVFFVLYPNPFHLVVSMQRLKNPPVMPIMVSDLARELEGSSPGEVEQFVYSRLPYSYDWEVYNVPWYFPTLNEALMKGTGDCKARFLLFASLMEELGIPYRKHVSLTHIWLDYEGKPRNTLENMEESMLIVDESGGLRFSLPRPDLSRATRSLRQGFWEVMPAGRKYLLLTGFPVIYSLFYLPPVLVSRHALAYRPGPAVKQKVRLALPSK